MSNMLADKTWTGAEAVSQLPDDFADGRNISVRRPPSAAPPIPMLGVVFDPVTFAEALERIDDMVATRQPHYIATANVDFLAQARRDTELRRILLDAHLVLCDGTPLVWASRLLGRPLPERVAGSDLVPELLRLAARKNYRLFFLGATPEAGAQAMANVRTLFPNIEITHYSPPFRPLAGMNHHEIRKRIRAAQPDLLLVAFGCPKAEKWMAMNYQLLGVPVIMGVGGTIDFLAGRLKRAPRWMQRAGLEWVFRLFQEPRRLFRRYAMDLWYFGWAMTVQLWRVKIRDRRGSWRKQAA
jgi:exopolysaccharide biosynthesis WecB/TagA/CpsF family protein